MLAYFPVFLRLNPPFVYLPRLPVLCLLILTHTSLLAPHLYLPSMFGHFLILPSICRARTSTHFVTAFQVEHLSIPVRVIRRLAVGSSLPAGGRMEESRTNPDQRLEQPRSYGMVNGSIGNGNGNEHTRQRKPHIQAAGRARGVPLPCAAPLLLLPLPGRVCPSSSRSK